MTTKQPSHSGERPATDASPTSSEQPFDPSRFAKHEFPVGLREELIRAEKPSIDPKFLHDTVPPNRKPVLTETEAPVTTPRGGFVVPKPQSGVDRDAPTLLAVPVAKPSPSRPAAATAESPSAPPVDTSRDAPTVLLPRARPQSSKRGLVIGLVAALLLLIVAGLMTRPSGDVDIPASAPPPKAPPTVQQAEASEPPVQPSVAPPVAPPVATAATAKTQSTATAEPPRRPKASPHEPRTATPTASEPKAAMPSAPAPSSAPRGKQPWIDGL